MDRYNPGAPLAPDLYNQGAEEHHYSQQPNEVDELIGKLINALRQTNITAGPPAHIKPTVWSNPVDLSASFSLPAGITPFTTVVSFRCPPGYWTRIESYGMNVRDPAYAYDGNIVWRLLKNGIPIPQGLENITQQRGSIVEQRPVNIILVENGPNGQGDVIEFQVSRVAAVGGPQDIEMAFSGWTWRLRNNYEGTQGSVTAY
jgi:hypothetical protein